MATHFFISLLSSRAALTLEGFFFAFALSPFMSVPPPPHPTKSDTNMLDFVPVHPCLSYEKSFYQKEELMYSHSAQDVVPATLSANLVGARDCLPPVSLRVSHDSPALARRLTQRLACFMFRPATVVGQRAVQGR